MAPCRRIAAPALYATFGSCLIYASGLAFVPVWIAIEARGVPEPDSVLWRLVFPLQSLTSPTALHDVVASGDPTRLPWFDEAAPWFLLAVVVEVVIDVALLGGRLYALNDAVGSLALGLLSRVGGAAFTVSMAPAYTAIFERWSFGGAKIETVWTWWVGFLAVDGAYWVFHLASHKLGWLWASHSVHHSSEYYNLTTALRQPLIDGIAAFVPYLAAAFVVPLPVVMAHKSFNLLWQFYLHTQVIGRLPAPIEYIFNTPSHHRVHHGRNPRAIDRNFASIFILWDRACGTFEDEDGPGAAAAGPLVFGVVPPLRSFSPVVATASEWLTIARKMRAARGVANKAALLVLGPAWRYSAKAGGVRATAVPPIGHRLVRCAAAPQRKRQPCRAKRGDASPLPASLSSSLSLVPRRTPPRYSTRLCPRLPYARMS